MNRRDFMKWIGKLFAALPFVALADLEPEPELTEWWGVDMATGEGDSSAIQFMSNGETIHSISLKGILVFHGQYSDKQIRDFWQQFRNIGGQEYYQYLL